MRSQILIWLGRCRVPFSPASHRLVPGLWYLKTCTQPPHWLPPVNTPPPGPIRSSLAFPVECEGWDWLGARWRDEITIRLGPSLQTQDKQGICGRETDMLSSHSHCPWLVNMTEVCSDNDSLVRLNNNASPLDSQHNVEEKTEKCEISRPTPIQLPDKKPWLTPPMVPTPLLPLPTLSFTVSQVGFKKNI